MNEIIKRLAYTIWERRKDAGFTINDASKNYAQAKDMINRVLEDVEDVASLSAYLGEEDIYGLTKIKASYSGREGIGGLA